jgi:hypothetical protein
MDKKITDLLADMVFAYANKDKEMPHDFEIDTLNETCDYLDKNYIGNKYSQDFFKKVKKDINKKQL